MPVDTGSSPLMQIERMFLQRLKLYEPEYVLVGRLKNHPWRHTGFPRLDPAQYMQTPAVAWLQTPKPQVRPRGDQVVAMLARKFKKIFRHLDANEVGHAFLSASTAAPVAKKSGQRIETAREQLPAEHVFFVDRLLTHTPAFYRLLTGNRRRCRQTTS